MSVKALLANIPETINVTDDWSGSDKEALSRVTYPVNKDHVGHYPFHFTDGLTFWRVLTDYKSKPLLAFVIQLVTKY